MATANTRPRNGFGQFIRATTHETAPAQTTSALGQLRRLVLAHMLWEDTFYVDGHSAADLMVKAIEAVPAEQVRDLAIEARTKMKLRHVPLLLAREMARLPTHRHVVADTLAEIIQRPDELTEYLAMYWKDGKKPLSNQSKDGLARAFIKFNEYSMAKYNRQDAKVKLRDVMFQCHPRPTSLEMREMHGRIAMNTLATPDTWEVAISATKGEGKKAEWERLLAEQKLGALALIRNIRNMTEAKVDRTRIADALATMSVERVLPFRFITAARHNVQWEPEIEAAMLKACAGIPKLPGRTALLVDNSGSMYGTKVSKKSELERADAAQALAILAREVCEKIMVIGFGSNASILPARRGFALRDQIKSGPGGGTNTEFAKRAADTEGYDRIIIITDEQSHQGITAPLPGTRAYLLNVANYQNGIGHGPWVTITGWSEAVLSYIAALEGITYDGGNTET